MMRPRIPLWQRRLMRPEFNGQQSGAGPWRHGGTETPPRGPGPGGPRGLLDTPPRPPLHARTPYDRPVDAGPGRHPQSQVDVNELPETQKQLLGMIDLAKKQLDMEREKILSRIQKKEKDGPQSEMPGLLGERPDGPIGKGLLGKGPVSERPGLLGQRPDQKFPGPSVDAGPGSRMNGVRPPMNGPRPLMGLPVRPTGGLDGPRGAMPSPRGPGLGLRGPVPDPDDRPGPRGPMANLRQPGPLQNPRQLSPMQNPGQMGPMQNPRQPGPLMQNPRQMGPGQTARQPGPLINPQQMRGVDSLSQGGPMQNPRLMGSRGSGLNGPVGGPRPLMRGMPGPGGPAGEPGVRGSLLQNQAMSRTQLPAGGPQRPGLSSSFQGPGNIADWRERGRWLPQDTMSRSQDLSRKQPQGFSDWLRERQRQKSLGLGGSDFRGVGEFRGGADFRGGSLDSRDFDSGFAGDRFSRPGEKLPERKEDLQFQPLEPLDSSQRLYSGGREFC